MIVCPSCGRENRPGMVFCSECGTHLITGGTLQTDPLPEEELPHRKASPWASTSVEEPDAGPPTLLRIKVVSSGREVELPLIAEVNVGRVDRGHGIVPELDLTRDVTLEDGVSRRHCKIHRRGSRYLIEDVGSANGTFLNGRRLTPYLLHVLSDGDELQLGRAKLEISIQD
jgi:pSer/pThr/pTyr-binding forkhead associated (FHA) protein